MPKDSIAVVFKGYDELSGVIKTIASSGKGLSKEYEELERRGKALSSGNEKLQKKIGELTKQVVSARNAMREAEKQFKKTGDEADGITLAHATQEYEKYSAALKEAKSASEIAQKSMKNTAGEMMKLFDKSGEVGKSSSGGFLSSVFGDDLGGKLAKSGIFNMAGDATASLIGAAAESAIGQPLATLGSSIVSGVASGAAAGAMAGIPGIGAVIGGAAGLVSGSTQILSAKDDAFKDYYRGLYEDTNAATAERLASGTTLAAERETTKLSFNTLLGDDKKAGAFLEQVQDTANTTPFLYDDLVGFSKTMLSFGMAVGDIIPTLTKVGDAGAALGLSTGDIGTVATYLGRMQSSNKATLEYLNPLNERGFSVFQWLADDQGVSVGDVYSQISKGELSGSYVSDVILTQFEKLYAGMMDIQSKSTEGLDSTLQGLKENVDAAGGERYNDMRNVSKEADIAAYGGYLGGKLAELSAIGGEVQAYSENLKDQYQREALEAVLTRTIDRENTVFSAEDTEKLVELSAQYKEAEEAYNHGSIEAGQKMVDLKEEAEALATAAYESSEWAQKQVDMQIEQIDATRELTAAMVSATDAWRTNNAFSKGGAAGNYLLKIFGIGRTEEEQKEREANMASMGDPMLVDIGGASGWTGAKKGQKNRPGYAYGLEYVPYDEFPALLHQGERVLTAAEARTMDRLPFSPALEPLGADRDQFLDDWAAGTFAFGLKAVPYDGFPALLHQGERIEPPAEQWGGENVRVTLHVDSIIVQGSGGDAADEIAETLAQKLREAMLRGGG